MRKGLRTWGLMLLTSVSLGVYAAGCGSQARDAAMPAAEKPASRVVQYLGKEYTLPVKAEKIVVTGALEGLEDLLALGVKPVGSMSIGGTFPAIFADILQEAKPIGERMQPSFETLLQIRPDVIISSDKFPAATAIQLGKIAPTIPLSHFPGDGEANLRFLGELTGSGDKAEAMIRQYRQKAAAAQDHLPARVKDKKVVAIRIRVGSISVYPAHVFFNDVLYTDLGLPVPAEIRAVKYQELISLEKFSEMDPDYIFLQYAAGENPAHPQAVENLQQNPIWRSLKAMKNNRVFVNVVDPLIQGVAIGGKIQFLEAALEKLHQ
ncbi:ABC transporter substrate-binding protein [Acetonema longum]|uniref:Periplasmic binding protein n=1 Tax=Acetonema longum DSM 6540 TaxID=1009370 RepID=F7NM60_9FIRM|nr:ABC transporter substrate-binding protein [Acetonema longum]EGO62861.1 periplasmic binding protein [Acetonema longum DSM 6540]